MNATTKAPKQNGAAVEQTEETLTEALLAAQIEMPAVEPDQDNPHFKSKFISLGHLLAKTKPVLNRHGLVLTQAPTLDDTGRFVLRTTILHISGDSVAFDSPLTPTKDDPQGQGSAITYMRRYALAAALAIADQEDDDGNAATKVEAETGKPVVRLNPDRTERIVGGFKALKLPYKEIGMLLGSCGIDGLSANTPEAIQERVAGLSEVEADALEAGLEKKAQDDAATAPDEEPKGDPPAASASTAGGDDAGA